MEVKNELQNRLKKPDETSSVHVSGVWRDWRPRPLPRVLPPREDRPRLPHADRDSPGVRQAEQRGQEQEPKEWREWKAKKKARKRARQELTLIAEMEKKRKVADNEKTVREQESEAEGKVEGNGEGRSYTLSIALPGSILDNAQSPELRTYLAGQIARAAVVFNVDEIIVFDETGSEDRSVSGEYSGVGKKGHCNVQLARILQFLECPQYLRKAFFPMHSDLKYAGLLNPLDCPHHMRADADATYREGVVLDQPVRPGKGSYCDVGLLKSVQVDKNLQSGLRVTVKMGRRKDGSKKEKGQVVAPSTPRTESGLYWGYQVRLAPSLSSVFTESPFKGGYDVTIGTSERGESVDGLRLDTFSHLLVVFGGVQGLEAALSADDRLMVEDPSLLFHHYLNTCPSQGSRTIRTEEAILITLSALRPTLTGANNT